MPQSPLNGHEGIDVTGWDLSTSHRQGRAGEARSDAIFVVRYPTRAAFLSMVASPDYQAITELRTNGLEAAVLQATTPWT